ncbi:MAG: Transglutaminase domain protein [Candidatus Woesebacteria bacterium GW2011_GWA1_39_8]|uniref:Transglutaminase domain protein n=1 Tax=Candidatus Woesebacteria bacterium GW2011_GWA1_39_8 TaxID=1618552 RepID=A0A0G0SVJ8_9BACT|nr:MAG: Transglutaminase domain protein [Candidatus Woesebacteria bacterium GW2011_GWA1_39_8]
MFLRKLFGLLILFLFCLIFPRSSFAQGYFKTSIVSNYKVSQEGVTNVQSSITITNLFTEKYAKEFVLNLSHVKPLAVSASEGDIQLSIKQTYEDDNTLLIVSFKDELVGKGKSRTFTLSYSDPSIASQTGEVWEISIPRIKQAEVFSEYQVDLEIPNTFGTEAYISPEAKEVTTGNDRTVYSFAKDDLEKSGITAAFGRFQTFSFKLKYKLNNADGKKGMYTIALPPDTSLQKLYYQNIHPEPDNIKADEDGNWLASYSLGIGKTETVEVTGYVQIFASPRHLYTQSPATFLINTTPTNYWEVNDPTIKTLAKQLQTPENIYNWITQNLKYNYQKLSQTPTRLGAVNALKNPNDALCTEFTDLFVALARSAGIPAREIEGFAYTENPKSEPLSLVAEVLHAWPEYWDSKTNTWIPVDPTWGVTTGGVDYFHKLDLRHFAFVIHGSKPDKPIPAGSISLTDDSKDAVYITYGSLPEKRNSTVDISTNQTKFPALFSRKLKVVIQNTGPVAIYDVIPKIAYDNTVVSSDYISILPPFAKYVQSVNVEYGILASNAPDTITITAYGEKVSISTNRSFVIIEQLLILMVLILLVVFLVFFRFNKTRILLFRKR